MPVRAGTSTQTRFKRPRPPPSINDYKYVKGTKVRLRPRTATQTMTRRRFKTGGSGSGAGGMTKSFHRPGVPTKPIGKFAKLHAPVSDTLNYSTVSEASAGRQNWASVAFNTSQHTTNIQTKVSQITLQTGNANNASAIRYAKAYLKNMTGTVEVTNFSSATTNVKAYIIAARRQSIGTITTYATAMTPENSWYAGEFDTLGLIGSPLADPRQAVGDNPNNSPMFRDWFKIIGTRSWVLDPGQVAKLAMRIDYNAIFRYDLLSATGLNMFKWWDISVMFVHYGAPDLISGSSNVTTLPTKIGIVMKHTLHWNVLQYDLPSTHMTNVLATGADASMTQVNNDSGAVQTYAEAT